MLVVDELGFGRGSPIRMWITDADVAGLQTQLARTAALLTQQRNSL